MEQQAQALNAEFQVKAQQLRSSESRAAELDDRVSALSANKTVPADAPAQLRLIVGAIPPATDGLRQCAAAALQTASNALDVAVKRANSVARLNGSATSVATACVNAAKRCSRPARRAVGSRQAVTTGAARSAARQVHRQRGRLRSSWRRVSAGVTAPVCNGIAPRLCSSNAPPRRAPWRDRRRSRRR